jgi:predicted nucleotidyltransferase
MPPYFRATNMNMPENLLYEELRKSKAQIERIARSYRADNIRLFGSTVRGEARVDSDIDLLVDFLPGATLLDQAGLIDELSQTLDRKVDVVSARALNKHLRARVLKEALPL